MGFQANPHAQRLATGRLDRTVPIFSLYLDLGSGTRKLQALQRELQKRGYDAPLHAYGNFDPYHPVEQAKLMAKLCSQRPPAIVCHASGLEPETVEELRRYQAEGGIVVTYDHALDLDCDRVIFDWQGCYAQALRHLKELGHRDIGWHHPGPASRVAQIDDNCRELGEPPGSDSWLPHFRDAMTECELPLRDEWLWSGMGDEPAGAMLGELYGALPHRPTALVIVNDRAVAGFIGALWRQKIGVPHDVSVVGHDNSDLAVYFPIPMTSISSGVEETAEAVVELAASRLEGAYSGPSREVIVRKNLICRATTCSPR
jgi:LacI family transcriptional regulator